MGLSSSQPVAQVQAGSRPSRRLALPWLLCGILFGGFALLRFMLLQPSADVFPDTDGFVAVSKAPLLSLAFWAGTRPPGFPLLLKLVGLEPLPVFVAQLTLAACCWGALALAIASQLQLRWLRPVAFGLILAFSLSHDVVQWDLIRHSESLASSLFALFVALLVWSASAYRDFPRRARRHAIYVSLPIAAALWTSVRDTNAYLLLGLAGLMVAGVLSRRVRTNPDVGWYLGVAAAFVALFWLQNWSADAGGRWQYPLVNTLGKRILVDEQATAFFVAQGMPTSRQVMRYRDQFADAHGMAVFRNRNMAPFRDWLEARGKSTYIAYLLSRPAESLWAPVDALRTLLRPPNSVYGEWAGLALPRWVGQLSSLLYTRNMTILLTWAGITLLVALIAAGFGLARPAWLVPAALLALLYPMMFIVWHGDAMEVGRHSHLIGIQLRLALWMLAVFLVDSLVRGRVALTPSPSGSGQQP
jgi:hypothetical protein